MTTPANGIPYAYNFLDKVLNEYQNHSRLATTGSPPVAYTSAYGGEEGGLFPPRKTGGGCEVGGTCCLAFSWLDQDVQP